MRKLIIILLTMFCLACSAMAKTRYLLTLELKQSHYTLDIGKYIKDKFNKVQFTLPVDRDFYNSVKVGDVILDKFRSGSFWVEGSVGKWKIVVVKKTTRDE